MESLTFCIKCGTDSTLKHIWTREFTIKYFLTHSPLENINKYAPYHLTLLTLTGMQNNLLAKMKLLQITNRIVQFSFKLSFKPFL